jgi:hypothetical protein
MICAACEGRGFCRYGGEWTDFPGALLMGGCVRVLEICHDCGGSGVAHCCEGLIANETPTDKHEACHDP